MSDEVGYIFVGIVVGIPLGAVVGWLLAQIAAPKQSAGTILVQKLENGSYAIVEK